jgi:hypothetical protein
LHWLKTARQFSVHDLLSYRPYFLVLRKLGIRMMKLVLRVAFPVVIPRQLDLLRVWLLLATHDVLASVEMVQLPLGLLY